jgi:hypothetical protein
MRKIIIGLKWGYLRWKVKRQQISFKKCLIRMYWIQELEKLPQYNVKELAWLSYSKIKKMFIKEFPNKHLHNPYKD